MHIFFTLEFIFLYKCFWENVFELENILFLNYPIQASDACQNVAPWKSLEKLIEHFLPSLKHPFPTKLHQP